MIERWLVAIRDHPARPPAMQRHVLTCLALRVNWETGSGFASSLQLEADADASKWTVWRATKWARGDAVGLLLRTRRGHRVNDGTALASEWQLTLPTQGCSGATLEKPRVQNHQPKGAAARPKGAAQTHHQESVFPQESSSSARATRHQDPNRRKDHADPGHLAALLDNLKQQKGWQR